MIEDFSFERLCRVCDYVEAGYPQDRAEYLATRDLLLTANAEAQFDCTRERIRNGECAL